jgi:hypothetical protein
MIYSGENLEIQFSKRPLKHAGSIVTQLSYLRHYAQLTRKCKSPLQRSMLIISSDVDVGSPELARINQGKRDNDVNLTLSEHQIGTIEELAIPQLIDLFNKLEIPITIAVRGQLMEVQSQTMAILLDSGIKHDIGAHGYTHKMFTQLSKAEAEEELRLISSGMNKYGLEPKTFIFPRNQISHLDLLEKYTYSSYRGKRYSALSDGSEKPVFLEKERSLYNIPSSIFIGDPYQNPFLLKKMLDLSIENNLPFHVWFHFWNFGHDKPAVSKSVQRFLYPFLLYAKKKCDEGLLDFETMFSAAQKAKKAEISFGLS